MDVLTAIYERKSIRGFLPDPVDKQELREILAAACRAPSAMNIQPWEFCVVTGDALNRIREGNIESIRNGVLPEGEHQIMGWPPESVYRKRQVALAKELFRLMGIAREDEEKKKEWGLRGFRYFDAPVVIFILQDRTIPEGGHMIETGAVMQTICLAAQFYGISTCIEDQGVMYPDVVREHTGIPREKRVIMAVAMGYADPDFPANAIQTERVTIRENTSWVGFAPKKT